MRTTMKMLTLAVGMLMLSALASAQTILNNTTLAAVIDNSQDTITLTSVANVAVNDIIFIAGYPPEAMRVVAIVGTSVRVIRGSDGTRATAHANATRVFTGPANRFHNQPPENLNGACVRTAQQFSPWIELPAGNVWSCDAAALVWRGANPMPLTYNSTPVLVQFLPREPQATSLWARLGWAW